MLASRVPDRLVSLIRLTILAAGAASPVATRAQELPPPAAPARAIAIEYGANLTETATDNRRLATTDRSADIISQPSASVRVTSRSGRLVGSADYSLTGYVSAHDSSTNRLQSLLNANGVGELWERHLFVDMAASISQQSISAFGVQTIDPALNNPNRTEVRTLSITPRLNGRIGDLADVQASVGRTLVRNSSTGIGDSATSTASVTATSNRRGALGWNANVYATQRAYESGRSTAEDSATVGLTYTPRPELLLSANGGRESNDVTGPVKKTTTRWGVGIKWSPSPRTQLDASYNHRYFGEGHSLSFEHRLPRSVIRLSSTRDVNTGTPQNRQVALGSAFDLFYSLFASVEPDPIKRTTLVNNYLRSQGIDPGTTISTGFLSSAVTLQRNDELSYAVQFIRSSASLTLLRSESRRLDPVSTLQDDLSTFGAFRQRSITLNLGHRLTPLTGMSLDLSQQWTDAASSSQESRLRTIRLNFTTALGLRTSGSLSLRHAVFTSLLHPYQENALTATVGIRF